MSRINKSSRLTLFFLMAVICVICGINNVYAEVDSIGNVVYSVDKNNMITAEVDISAVHTKAMLILCSYDEGRLREIKCDSKIDGKAVLSAQVENGDYEICASVIEGVGGKVLMPKAVYGVSSTDLKYIKVNGNKIEGYSDDLDSYILKCTENSCEINAVPKDGGTKVSVSDVSVPGIAEITVVSAYGDQRKITIGLYNDESQIGTLSSLKYQIGDTVYDVENFTYSSLRYSVELPENTMSVQLLPQGIGEISTKIEDKYVSLINEVSLGKFVGVGQTAYEYKRKANNNVIPIKNETVTAYVTVTYGTDIKTYQIVFTCKQPRLTSFEYVGASSDSNKPVFIGGSAVNNDNGTIFMMDRRWAIGNISKSLVGGSCFIFPAVNKDSNNQWWSKNATGEYFNFTADTAGTIYLLSGDSITNQQYNDWSKSSGAPPVPSDYTWLTVAKDWNDYGTPYFASSIEYQSDSARADNPGIEATTGNSDLKYSVCLSNVAYRKFNAGEKVSVYHTGKTGVNAAKTIAIVVWDNNAAGPEEPEQPIEDIEDPDKVMSLVFDDASADGTVWSDTSGYKNDVTLYIDDNNKWTENGFMAANASGGAAFLPTAVVDAVNSNVFTLQFQIDSLSPETGKVCSIISSENGAFDLFCNSNKVYLKWAGLTSVIARPSVMLEDVIGHVNTITVDKSTNKICWYVDGVIKSEKNMKVSDSAVDTLVLGSTDSTHAGSVVFKDISVYKKCISASDLTGGDQQ